MVQKHYSIADIIGLFRDQLIARYGEGETMQFLYLLFESWKGMSRSQVQLHRSEILSDTEEERFVEALERLKTHEPIQYIIGETSFCGISFEVTQDVLIPRPETEELVSLAASDIRTLQQEPFSLLDIGTGSGCIAISLAKMFPSCNLTALDVSESALNLAKRNALHQGCSIRFILADILEKAEWVHHPVYHMIISNPPYVTESDKAMMQKNVLDYEPSIALFVHGQDPLLYYRAIAEFSKEHLIAEGLLWLEINEKYGEEIREILLTANFRQAEILRDIHEKPRFVRALR